MPKKIIPTDYQIERCAGVLLERDGVVIDSAKLRAIVESEPVLCRNLKGYPDNGKGLDTYERGYLGFAVAKSLGWDDWPTFGDSEDTRLLFYRDLCKAGYIPDMTVEQFDASNPELMAGKTVDREVIRTALYEALSYWGTLPEPEGDVPERYHRWDDLGEIAEKIATALERKDDG